MAWLYLLAAILGLVFPPVGFILLAMMVFGVFTKGLLTDSQDQLGSTGGKARLRRGLSRRQQPTPHLVTPPPAGEVIDVTCSPVLPPLRLPAYLSTIAQTQTGRADRSSCRPR